MRKSYFYSVNEAFCSVNEAFYFINKALNSVDEAFYFINEALNSVDEYLNFNIQLFNSPIAMQNRNLTINNASRDALAKPLAKTTSNRQPFLEIKDVSKVYPTKKGPFTVLDGVNLNVNQKVSANGGHCPPYKKC